MIHFTQVITLTAMALAFSACSSEPETARSTQTPTPQGNTRPAVPAVKPTSFASVEALVAEGDRAAALRIARELALNTDRVTLDRRLDGYWNPTSETRDEVVAAVLAEGIALELDEVYSASYIAGLTYDLGIGVEKDLARVVEFWDDPDVHPVPSAQERLAEIYSDKSSDLYDMEKAAAARKRARDAS